MDYFSFDLQLFAAVGDADISVNLASADEVGTAANTKYLGSDGVWYTSVVALLEQSEQENNKLVAVLATDKKVTIAVGESGKDVRLLRTGLDALRGYTVSVAKGFTINEETYAVSVTNDATAVTATVTLGTGTSNAVEAIVSGVKSATSASTSVADAVKFDKDTAGKVTLPVGTAISYGDDTDTKKATAVTASVVTVTASNTTIVSGTVDVQANGTVKVAGTAYAAKTDEPMRLTVAAGDTIPTLVQRPDPTDATKTVASNIELAANTSIVIGGVAASDKAYGTVVKNTATSGATKVSVSSSGVVTGLDANDTFSVTDSTADDAAVKTYKAVAVTGDPAYNYIVVNGANGGVYKITDLAKASVTAVAGAADTVAEKDAATQPTLISALAAGKELAAAASTANTPYFAVYYDGGETLMVKTASDFSGVTGQAGAIGFFEISKDANKKATVVYKNLDAATADACTVSKLTGNFAINFNAMAAEGLTAIDVTGLTSGNVSLKSVAQTVETVTGNGQGTIEYIAGNKPATNFSLTLPQTLAAGTYYWVLEPDEGSVDTRARTAYKVANAYLETSDPPSDPTNKAFFKVTVATDANNTGKFKATDLTFAVNGSGAPASLTEGQWESISVKANSTTNLSTFTVKSDAPGTYVLSANRGGAAVTETAKLTVDWVGDPEVEVWYKPDNDDAATTKSITLPTSNTPEYWKVELDETTGNPKYTITKVANKNAAGTSYFEIKRNETTVTVAYTTPAADPISLSGITTGAAKTPVQIKVDATGIDKTYTIDIRDGATGEITNVDYVVSNVPAGAKVETGADGKDTVNYKETWENDISFALSTYAPKADGIAYVEVLADGDVDKNTGYRKTKLGDAFTPVGADDSEKTTYLAARNYFMIQKAGNVYTVTYVKGNGSIVGKPAIDLETATKGETVIDATGYTKADTIQLTKADKVAFSITNAAVGLTALGSTEADDDNYDQDKSGVVTYIETYALKNATLSVPSNASDLYWVITNSGEKGANVYEFATAQWSDLDPGGSGSHKSDSYFKVTKDASGNVTVTFNGRGDVKAADLSNSAITEKIALDATNVTTTKKLTLTDDEATGTLNYNVTNLVKGVTVEKATANDELHYAKTFEMDSVANKLVLGAEEGTKYYAVTTSGGDSTEGLLTVSIGEEIVIPADATEDAKALILAKAGNYFIVETEDAGNNNDVTIMYHIAGGQKAIDLSGAKMLVNVDASGANDKAKIIIAEDNADVQKYNITGLTATNTVQETTGTGIVSASDQTFVQSYAISGTGEAATPLELDSTAHAVGKVVYYAVADRTGGDVTSTTDRGVYTYAIAAVTPTSEFNIGDNVPAGAGDHYFKVTYATETGVKIEYVNADGDVNYDFSKTVGKAITIDASKLGDAVTTIDITDTATNAGVDYALVNVPTTVTTIEGQTAGKDTVSYKETAVWAAGQVLTLADAAVQYFVVGGTKTAATVTAADEKPANAVNYFTVTRTTESTTPATYKYTVTYTPAASGDAFDFSGTKSGTLEIAAGALPGTTVSTGTILALGNTGTSRYANVAITGAKGSLKVTGNKSDAAPYDTISYAQPASEDEFDGTPGIYYIKVADSKANFPASLQGSITSADKDTTFVEVTVAQDSTTKEYTVTVTASGLKPNEHTGVLTTTGSGHGATTLSLMAPGEENSKLTIAAGTTFTEITGVAKGSVLKNVAATTVVTSKTLTKGDTITVDDNGTIAPATEVFTSGGGAISVTGGKGTSGVFELAVGDATKMNTLTGSKTAAEGDYQVATVTGNDGEGDGKVYVTFANGTITGVTGLDDGETLTVKKVGSNPGTNDVTYTYSYDATTGYVTRKASDSSPDMYAAVTTDASGTINVNLLERGYNLNKTQAVGGFTWVEGTYYVAAGNTAGGASTITYVASPTDKADSATSGTYYIEAKVTDSAGKKVLTLMPYKGNAKGLVDPAWDFKGTVTVNASDQPVQIDYTKDRAALFNVAFTNVKAGSVFKCMKEYVSTEPDIPNVPGDTIETVALAEGESIAVQDYNGGTNVVYAAGTGGSVLKFNDEALASGTIAAVNNAVIANGSTISGVTGAIDIAVETKDGKTAISSIKNIGGTTETVTITDADGKKTTFAAVSDTEITKTEETATGEKTVTTLKITAGADVWKATGTTKIFNNFGWADGKSGYYKFTSGKATLPASGTDLGEVTGLDAEHAGDAYVKADVAVKSGVTTLTLSAYVVDATGALVPAASTDTTGMNVVVAPTSAQKYNFSNKGNSFNVEIGNASADSVFTDMNTKDVVKTDTIAATTGKFTVNGNVWTAATASKFAVYVESDSVTRLVEGNVLVKGTLEASKADGSDKQTLTYSPSTATGAAATATDGVVVQYGDGSGTAGSYGVATAIKGLDAGESVTIVTTGSDNKKTTVTYEALADAAGTNLVCYYSDGTTVKYIDISNSTLASGTNVSYADTTAQTAYDTTGHTFTAADTKAFDFATTTSAEAYFAVTDKEATVATRTTGETYSYKDYGKTFVHATYAASGTALTLKKVTVDKNGAFTSDGNFAGTETISVSAAGKTIVYADRATNNMKSLVVSNAGAGTTIAGWKKDDILSTDTLAAPTYNDDGTIKTSAKVTLGGHDYTASEKGSLTITGETVAAGKLLLLRATTTPTNGEHKITALSTGSDNSTLEKVVEYMTTGGDGVSVTVSAGKVTKITGLGNGEKVTVTTTAKDNLGNPVTVENPGEVTYEAAIIPAGEEKAGQLKVTKTAADGTQYTHVFADATQDILSDVAWTVSSQKTESLFDFADTAKGATGYFAASAAAGDTTGKKFTVADIKKQSTGDQPLVSGGKYLEVVASKDTTGKVTISSMRIVELVASGSKKGTFSEISGATVTTAVKMDASAYGSIDITAAANTIPLAIKANAGKIYSGLGSDDTLEFTGTAGNKVTVNDITYVAGDANKIVINGEGAIDGLTAKSTIQSGVLQIKDAVITDEAGNTIVGKADGSTAIATFAKEKGITDLSTMAANETVTVTAADGTVTKWATDSTDNTKVTRTVTANGVTETWKKTITANDPVFGWESYVSNNKFDFGATAATQVGYFAIANQIAKTAEGAVDNVTLTDNNNYVRIVAEKGSDGVYTIKSLKEFEFKAANNGSFDAIDTTNITINSDGIGSMTLAADAIVLPKDDTSRDFAIAITNAKAGSTFTGFGAKDTVAGTLKNGETLTMVTTDEKGKEAKFVWTGGTSSTAAMIRGDGKAVNGTFTFAGGSATMEGGNALNTFTTKVTGAAAQIAFTGGNVTGIYNVGSGTVKIEKTTVPGGVVTTETYAITANGDNMNITKTVVADGVTTIYTGTTGKDLNAMDASYTISGEPTLKSAFDWTTTSGTGTGYFLVSGVTTSAGKITAFETATIEKQTKFTAEKGAYYLKAVLSKDGVVSELSMVQLKDDGTLSDNLLTSTTKGAITINGDGNAVTLNVTGTNLTLVGVDVQNVAAKSNITMKAGDTLKTATLAADDKVTVQVGTNPLNAKTFTSGASAALEVLGSGTTPVVVNGSVKGTDKATIAAAVPPATEPTITPGTTTFVISGEKKDAATDDVTVTIKSGASGTTEDDLVMDAPVVTVVNGVVTNITGITKANSSVRTVVAGASGLDLTYGLKSLTIAAGTFAGKTIKTVPLAAGTVITEGSTNKLTTAADGEVVMVYEGSDLTVKSGKFQFTATGSVTASGAKQDDANDNTVVAVTKATGNTNAVYVEIGSSTTGEGILRSVKGLEKGDIITVTTKQAKADGSGYDTVVTTYTATTATSITKAVTLNGTAQEGKGGTANITAGAEILSGVTYIGGDTPIDATENPLEGQLNWASIDGRATGYFELAEKTKTVSGEKISYKTTTVVEQPTKKAVKIPRAGKSNYYLQASIDNSNGNELTFTAWQFDSTDGKTISKQTAIDLTDKTKVTANDMITITAPTTTSISFDKGTAQYGLTVNKLAAGSAFKGLDAGDKVTTNTLDNTKYEYVTMDSVNYFAGAKKALTFIGEGDATPKEGSATNTIRLLSGTIRLNDYNTTAYLAGAKDATGGAADDIKIEVNDDTMLEDGFTPNSDNVIVNVANGVITSITGLTHQNATVTVTAGTVKSVYKVVDANGTMIERQELKASDDSVQSTAYRTVVKGKEIYDAKANGDKGTKFTVADKYTSTAVDWATEKATTYVNLPTLATAKTLAKGSTDADIKSGEFQATYGQYYLKVDMATKNNATTISGVTLQQADATGKLANVKVDKTTGEPAYKALLAIDGTISDGKFAKVTYKLPTTKTWTFKADNVALGSTFTNLGTSDVVQTANGSTFALGTDGKAFTVYVTETVGGVEKLSTQQVTYSGAGAVATYTTTNGLVVTGLDTNKETLTIVSDSATSGLVTTKYTYQADGTIKKEVTNAAGLYQVFISTTDDAKAETTDATIGGVKFQAADTSKTKIASDFDWTLDKNTTAYAVLSNNAATIKAGKNPAVKAGSRYIALTLDGSTAKKGVVATVDAVEYNAATGVALVESAISNATITVNAPTKFAMTFDRTTALTNNTLDADSTKFNFSGAVSGSKFTTLAVGDIVKTASLDSTKSEYVAFDGDVKFTAGKKGQLAFTKTDEGFSLTSGTIKLAATGGASTEGATFAYAGTNRITADNLGITVTATTNSSGTTFTIGELTEGEVFRVEDASGNEWKYSRSGSTLFCEKTGSADAPMVMAFTKNSIASKELLSATATPKAWKSASAETLVDTEDGNKAINTANYKALKVDLATLDKRIATDTRATSATTVAGYTYDFVVDKYLAPLSRQAATLSAFVANETGGELLADLQTVVGSATGVTTTWRSYSAAASKVAQTIQAAKDWNVTGSDGNDVIIGASSTSTQRGSVTISGGAGDDTITGGGATEVFTVGNGNDVLQKYATGKDKVDLTAIAGFQVDLSGTAKVDNKTVTGVLLHDGKDADGNTTNSVLLAGMGNGKAVEITTGAGYAKYYFGDGTKTRGNATFNFEEGAYYFANAAMNTTLKVATDKTKKSKNTLGENVTVDLTKTDYYHDIDVIDASGSGNSVYLVANNDADSKTTLKGGTYQSTLQGGAGSDSLVGGGGEDVFWFEGLAGTDAISNYMVAKDAIYLGNNAITLGSSDGVQIAASGKADVVLTQGDNKVTIANALGAKKGIRVSTDGTTKNTLSYYVGNTGAKNTFTATIGTDMIASADDSTVTGADGAKLKDYSAKSYYVGSTAEDAVKLTSKTAVNGVFDINSFTSNLSSIEVLDATGLTGKANAVSSIALIGSTTGKSTLRGSTNANVHEKFVVATDVDTIVENLTKASDAITFSGAVSSYSVDSKGTTFNFEDGGTLLVSKVKYDSLSVSTKAGTTTITRTK